MNPGILIHRRKHIRHLISDRIKRCPHDMFFIHTACQSHDRTTRVTVPIWSAKPGKCRNNITPCRIIYLRGKFLTLCRIPDKFHLITQPLYRCACNEDRTFECIIDLSFSAPADRRYKPVLRKDRCLTGIHQKETARSICILRIARLKAILSKERCLLIACGTRDRDFAAQQIRTCITIDFTVRTHLWQHAFWNIQQF